MAVAQPISQSAHADPKSLEEAIDRARSALLAEQRADGHWCYELEADCTIPAEYVLMLRYLGEERPDLERKIRRR
jgi:squalene-hopene/tetraprenyl-beta-curcumene cyclase